MRVILFTFCAVFLLSCDTPRFNLLDKGVIYDIDNRYCGCCGGYLIEIEDETYGIDKFPDTSEIKLEEIDLPVKVMLKWEIDSSRCSSGGYFWINVEKIEIDLD